jgi:hypothetical protein
MIGVEAQFVVTKALLTEFRKLLFMRATTVLTTQQFGQE